VDSKGGYPQGEIQQVPRVGGGWRLDETRGVTAADVTGAHPGTLSGGASWEAGRTGNAVALDGSTGVVSTAGPAVRTDGSYTVAAWVRLGATGRDAATRTSCAGLCAGGGSDPRPQALK